MATAEQLPKGVGVVPDWWLACTPHDVRSPIDLDKQRRKRTTHEQMLTVRSLLDEVVADGELGGDLSNEDLLLKQQSMRKLQEVVNGESKHASSCEPPSFSNKNDADPTAVEETAAAAAPKTSSSSSSSHVLVTMTSEEERADVEANRTKSVKQHIGPELLNTSNRSNKRQMMSSSSSVEEKSSDENNSNNNNNKSLMVVSTVVTANSGGGGGGISSHAGGAYYNKAKSNGSGGVVPKKGEEEEEEEQDNKSPRIIVTMTSAEEAAAVEANQFVPHTEKFGPEILRKTNHHHEQKTGKENGVATSNGVSPRPMAQEEEEEDPQNQQTSVNADANQESLLSSSDSLSRQRNPLGFLHRDNTTTNNKNSGGSSGSKSYKTSFTGASPFDFAMQQKAREKERRAKERIYKESLAQHHGHSVEVDKAAKLLAKEREQRRKKKEAQDNLKGFKIDLVADATFNKAAELRRLNQEDKRKKKEAEEMRRGHKFQPSINHNNNN